jgi:hypothetical protein
MVLKKKKLKSEKVETDKVLFTINRNYSLA